jgi:hypothetical protein
VPKALAMARSAAEPCSYTSEPDFRTIQSETPNPRDVVKFGFKLGPAVIATSTLAPILLYHFRIVSGAVSSHLYIRNIYLLVFPQTTMRISDTTQGSKFVQLRHVMMFRHFWYQVAPCRTVLLKPCLSACQPSSYENDLSKFVPPDKHKKTLLFTALQLMLLRDAPHDTFSWLLFLIIDYCILPFRLVLLSIRAIS